MAGRGNNSGSRFDFNAMMDEVRENGRKAAETAAADRQLELEKKASDWDRMQRDVNRLENEVREYHRLMERKDTEIGVLTTDRDKYQRNCREARDNHLKLGESYRQLDAQLKRDIENHNASIAVITTECNGLRRALQDHATATITARTELASGSQDLESLQSQLAMVTQNRNDLQKAGDELLELHEHLRGEQNQLQSINDEMLAAGQALEAQISNLHLEQTAMNDANEELKRRLEALQTACDAAIQEKNRLASQLGQPSSTHNAQEQQRSNRDSGNFNNVPLSTELSDLGDDEVPSSPLEHSAIRTVISITPVAPVASEAPAFTFTSTVPSNQTASSGPSSVNIAPVASVALAANITNPDIQDDTSSPSASTLNDTDPSIVTRKKSVARGTRRSPPRIKQAGTQTDYSQKHSVTEADDQTGNLQASNTQSVIRTVINIAPIAPVAPAVNPTAASQSLNTPTNRSVRDAETQTKPFWKVIWPERRLPLRKAVGTQTVNPQARNDRDVTEVGTQTIIPQVVNTPLNLGYTPIHNVSTAPILPPAQVGPTPVTVTASLIAAPRPRTWLHTLFCLLLALLAIFLALDYQRLASVRHAWLDSNETTRAVAYDALHSASTYEVISGPGHIPFGNVVLRVISFIVDLFRFGIRAQNGRTIPGARGIEGLEFNVESWFGISRTLLG